MRRLLWIAPVIALVLFWPARVSHAQGKTHTAVLTWVASTSSGVVKYNVYRSTTSGGGYANIGNTPATTLTFTDSTGTGGTKYFYVVTALDAGGDESANSNEVSGTFLVNPAPPTGLAVVNN
jgi:fibronectin type 3 domain-containing protein